MLWALSKMFKILFHLHLEKNVGNDDQEWVCKIKQEPNFNRLDSRCAWQTVRNRKINRGKNHHAGDVHSDDELISIVCPDVASSLVDNVHQDRR